MTSIPSNSPKSASDPYLDGLEVLREYAEWNNDTTLKATVEAIDNITSTASIEDDSAAFVAVESLITALLAATLRAEMNEQGAA